MPDIGKEPSGIGYLQTQPRDDVGEVYRRISNNELLNGHSINFKIVADSIANLRDEAVKNTNLTESQIMLYTQMIFGPLALDLELLKKREMPYLEKVNFARSQQLMCHKLLWGMYGNADPQTVAQLFRQWRNLEKIAATKTGHAIALPTLMSGIRNQVSIIQVLFDYGWTVVLPDYMTQPRTNYNQVADWDVGRGIDFLAIPEEQDRLILINAKGSVKSLKTEIKDMGNAGFRSELPVNIWQKYAPNQDRNKIFKAEVRISSRPSHRVEPVTMAEIEKGTQNMLSSHFLLNQIDADDILTGLEQLK